MSNKVEFVDPELEFSDDEDDDIVEEYSDDYDGDLEEEETQNEE